MRKPGTLFTSVAAVGLCIVGGCSSDETTGDGVETSDGGGGPQHLVESEKTPLAPGTYRFSVHVYDGVETPEASIDVPAGFDDEASWYVVSHDGNEFLGLWTVGVVYNDPCRLGKTTYRSPGPSVQNLAHALVAQRSTRTAAPEPMTVDGYRGLYVEIHSPVDMSKCVKVADLWGSPGGRGIYNDRQVDRVWILDVDGRRLVVNAAYSAESTAEDINKLSSMVQSLEFVPAAAE